MADDDSRLIPSADVGSIDLSHIALRPGDRVGRYAIRQVLGEGGFGVVFEAEQSEPVRRHVALKVIKPGMDSKNVVARFEAERQALALMDHPHVAKVFDGGLTERGLPYFVMELVKGEPIHQFCDRHRLGINERLQLMMKVCAAVQHAHTKGVIHRDLKPANILVGYESDEPSPKVIDFGVAKAVNQPLTQATVFTELGQLIGTPEYMSPEQAEMGATDIDTRSDVYSLGVLLYELLTGSRPFEPATLRKAGFDEIRRIIREVEPQKPSTRLSSLVSSGEDEQTVSRITRARRTEARSLTGTLRRDLDWVVMKCLEKERGHRYASASNLSEDLERFLHGEVLMASPPGIRRRLVRTRRRLLKSRWGLAGVTSLFVLCLIFLMPSMMTVIGGAARVLGGVTPTTDPELVAHVETELALGLESIECDAAMAIVVDGATGDLLAFSEIWNPSELQRPGEMSAVPHSRGIAESDLIRTPMVPGSLIKPLIWSVITEHEPSLVFGDTETGRSRVDDSGRRVSDLTVRNSMEWRQALTLGSNIALTIAAEKIRHEDLRSGLVRLGIHEAPGEEFVDHPVGVISSEREWTEYTQSSVAMGYETAWTPLQLVHAYTVFTTTESEIGLRTGIRTKRWNVLDRLTREHAIEAWIPPLANLALKEQGDRTVNAVRRIDPSISESLRILGYSGTTEVQSAEGGVLEEVYNASYIAMVPVESPRFIVMTLVFGVRGQAVRERRHYGGMVAAPIAIRIASHLESGRYWAHP